MHYSHGRRLSTYQVPHKVWVSARVHCCSQDGSVRQRRYATIAAEDIARDKPLKNPFPYPNHAKPTPHQIFHLPVHATQAQIKARYYELVHAHHPDSQHVRASQLPWDLVQHRFRCIKASYDYLSGRTLSPDANARPAPSPKNFDPYMHELARRRRAYYASQGRAADAEGWARPGWGEGFGAPKDERSDWNEDGWKERLILALGVVTLVAGLFPTMPKTLANTFLPTSGSAPPLASSSSPSSPGPSSPYSPTMNNSVSTTNTTTPSSAGFNFPFGMDFDKRHREAVSALVQVRHEREEMGVERREGLRKRVMEMEMSQSACDGLNHPPESALMKEDDSEATMVQDADASSSSCAEEEAIVDLVRDVPTSTSVAGVASCSPESSSASDPPI